MTQPIRLYYTSLDRKINHALVQRPIAQRPQPMFSCHCRHLLAPLPVNEDAAFQAAMDRNNN